MLIKQASVKDLDDIIHLFKETIENVNSKDYSFEQITVWSNGAYKKERWIAKIVQQFFILATIEDKIVGFGSMTRDGYLDFLYVSKDHQRTGIATAIYNSLEQFAKHNELNNIVSDVSITAKPFFDKQGFEVIQKQEVEIDEINLTNYKMQKSLVQI